MMGEIVSLYPTYTDSEIVNKLYAKSIADIGRIQHELVNVGVDLTDLLDLKIDQVSSNLDGYDYLFASVFGILGAVMSTRERIQSFCTQIHNHASGMDKGKSSPLQATLGNILHHENDLIDMVDGSFIDRSGNAISPAFHRLLWGHDPLSLDADNPFFVLARQHGVLKGVIQVFRHLVGDTFSKQGLPIPGHSLLDFTTDSGKTSNQLYEFSMKLADRQPVKAQQYFDHLFTINAQDVAAQGFVWATAKAYIYARGIKDATCIRQYKIVSYAVNFFAHAGIGAIRQGGVPYISWPALASLIKEIVGLFIDSYREIASLQKITDEIIEENVKLEKHVFATGSNLPSQRPDQYTDEFIRHDKNLMRLVDFFEEG